MSLGQNHNVRIVNKLFKKLTKFKYLGITVRNWTDILEQIKFKKCMCYFLLSSVNSWAYLFPICNNNVPSQIKFRKHNREQNYMNREQIFKQAILYSPLILHSNFLIKKVSIY